MDIYIHVHACKHLGMQNLTQILVVINHRSFFFFLTGRTKSNEPINLALKSGHCLLRHISGSPHLSQSIALARFHSELCIQHNTKPDPFFPLKKHTQNKQKLIITPMWKIWVVLPT